MSAYDIYQFFFLFCCLIVHAGIAAIWSLWCNMDIDNYRSTKTTVCLLNYHFVICPCYHRKIFLNEQVDLRFKELVQQICRKEDFKIVAMEPTKATVIFSWMFFQRIAKWKVGHQKYYVRSFLTWTVCLACGLVVISYPPQEMYQVKRLSDTLRYRENVRKERT